MQTPCLFSVDHVRSMSHLLISLVFSREFAWKGPRDPGFQYTNNYLANDTIEIIVGLIDSSETWVQTIDSFGVLRQVHAGVPILYGNDPSIMTSIETTVGGSYSNHPMRVDVKVIAKGDGPYYPKRMDNTGGRISSVLTNPEWADFREYMGLVAPKVNIREINKTTYPSILSIWPNPVLNGKVNIKISANEEGTRSIGVYDHTGRRIFVPLTNFTSLSAEASYQLPSSGMYYIVLFNGDDIEAVESVSTVN